MNGSSDSLKKLLVVRLGMLLHSMQTQKNGQRYQLTLTKAGLSATVAETLVQLYVATTQKPHIAIDSQAFDKEFDQWRDICGKLEESKNK